MLAAYKLGQLSYHTSKFIYIVTVSIKKKDVLKESVKLSSRFLKRRSIRPVFLGFRIQEVKGDPLKLRCPSVRLATGCIS